MSYFDFTGKVILVTGASSGIGRATAICASRLKAKVILLGRNKHGLEETLSQMSYLDNGHGIVEFDLLELNQISEMMKQISSLYGALDGLAHCAGIHMAKPLRIINENDIEIVMKMNVTTGILLAKAFRNKQVSNRPGSVVLLSSVVATVGQSAIVPYALSKGALVSGAKSLAVELAVENIRVNVVLPGVVSTPMSEGLFSKMGQDQIEGIKKAHLLGLGEPDDVAHSILFLLSNAAKWITGSCLTVDGGYTAI